MPSDSVIAVAGSSGLIGTALVYALRATDRRVLRMVRRAPSNADEVFWNPDTGEFDAGALRGVDAVVNLCGVNVGEKRWSGAFKQSLRDSRIGPTEVLARAVVDAEVPVLVNASAVGYYGNSGSTPVDESAGPGQTFLARLAMDWEAATAGAAQAGVRVVLPRTGLVMSRSGGMLGRIRPLFWLGLGARLGNGRQYLSWISLEDQVRALLFAIARDDLSGPVNFTGPAPVTNAEFTTALGRTVNRPTAAGGAGLRAAGGARRVRRRRCAGRPARDPGRTGARGFPLPPQHHPRGAGVRHAPTTVSSVDVMTSSVRSGSAPIEVRRLGTLDYQAAWELQREIAEARVAGGPDTLLLLQHPPVYTAGRRTLPAERPDPAVSGTPVVETDRGGKITWHGPGQLVGYPIIGLAEPLDVVNFVRRLEDSLIAVCADLGLQTGRVEGRSGVWVPASAGRPARKVAAIGIRVARATTLHGFALNCDCDLGAFGSIVPCGIADAGVTSLTAELGRTVTVERRHRPRRRRRV